jgi:radical SAM protein with 4Fe4S-binding SPASM domain
MSVLRRAARAVQRELSGFKAQASFVFEATQRCNHDCPHCYNAWKNPIDYPQGELATGETLALLDRMLDQTGARLVTLSGGEPLLRPDLFEIVDHLAERRVAQNLISNGRLLDEAAIARLVAKISVFELPLLSSRREVHDQLSGSPGAFDRVTCAIADLRLARAHVVAVFVATRLNLPTWRETAELAVALGVDGVMFNRFNPGGRGRENVELLQASPAELEEALAIAQEVSERYQLSISCSITLPPCLVDMSRYPRLGHGYCAAGGERAYYALDPLGNVRPCNHSSLILGNLRERTFASMVRSKPMRDFLAARPYFCEGCAMERVCQGGCKASGEVCSGTPCAMDPFLTAFHAGAKKVPPGQNTR